VIDWGLMRAPAPGLLALLLFLPACRGPEPARDRGRAIPVSVAVRAAPWTGPGGSRPPLDPRRLAQEVAESFRRASVFAEVAGPPEQARDGSQPDAVLELEVRGRRLGAEGSQVNPKAVLSTLLWFLTGFGNWWIDDRSYPLSDVEVHARLLSAGGPRARPLLEEAFTFSDLELDLWRRATPAQHLLALLLPSFWIEDGERAAAALQGEAKRRVRFELAESLRRRWAGAALRGEPGCFLVLDPPGGAPAPGGGTVDLRGWIAARAPLRQVRLLDAEGRAIARSEGRALAALSVPYEGRGEAEKRAWEAVQGRLGPAAPPPQAVYRLERSGLRGEEALRIEAWVEGQAAPARFTIALHDPR
jgi:hypothetical protein